MTLTLPEPELLQYSNLIGRPIDNTVLSAYMKCARRGLYLGFKHYRRSGPPGPALGFGRGWHYIMEANYSAPKTSAVELYATVELFAAEHWEDHQILDDYRTFQRAMLEYKNYLRQYGLPWDEEARTVGWPGAPMVEIASEVLIPGARHPYSGKMDRIIQVHGQYLVEDHKTSSRADSFAMYEMDNQMLGYAVIGQLLTQLPIAGVRINRAVIRKNDSELERRTIPYAQERLKQWMKNYDRQLDRLERDLELFEKNPDVAETQGFPLNFSACHEKFGMCTYAGVCSLVPRVWQDALNEDFEVKPWNPLEVKGDESAS